jgi:prevent-host-death family protein
MTMKVLNIAEAKARLAEILRWVAGGERVVIARRNRPVAELRAVEPVLDAERPAGLCRGEAVVPADFNAALPEEILAAFEGR